MSKKVKEVVKSDDHNVLDLTRFSTTSAKIRYLDSMGWSRGKIAKELNIIYQHVRNVLITPVSKPKEAVN